MDEQLVGTVTHYFPQIDVAAVEITGDELRIGDAIRVLGATSNFTQHVHSMELDYTPIESATTGQTVGIQVAERVRVKDLVFRIRAHQMTNNQPAAD